MLHVSPRRSFSSAGFNSSDRAYKRTCVSRLSIPAQPGAGDISLDSNSPAKFADQGSRLRFDRHQLRNGLTVLRDNDPVGVDGIENRETLLFELRRCHRLHPARLEQVRKYVHFQMVKRPGIVPAFSGRSGTFRDVLGNVRISQQPEIMIFLHVSAQLALSAVSASQAGRRRFDPGRPLF